MKKTGEETSLHEEKIKTSNKKPPPKQQPLWKGYVSLLIRAGVFIAILAVLFTQVLFLKRVSGTEMFPSLKDGDLALGFRLESSYCSGDVVLYEADGSMHFGRILTLGGNTVNISGNGSVEVNGITESGEEVLFSTDDPGSLTYPYEVPEDSVFILGDYRTEKDDSRIYGAILIHDIKGKVLTILRRRGL